MKHFGQKPDKELLNDYINIGFNSAMIFFSVLYYDKDSNYAQYGGDVTKVLISEVEHIKMEYPIFEKDCNEILSSGLLFIVANVIDDYMSKEYQSLNESTIRYLTELHNEFLIKAAQCGNETAINFCRDNHINYY